MKKAQVVSFNCILKDKIGNVISSTFNNDVITDTDGAGHQMLSALAEGLQDLRKGEHRRICLPADQAYGFYDIGLVIEVPRKALKGGRDLRVDERIQGCGPDGESRVFKVIAATAEALTLDGNHPLAGQDLVFEIEAIDAREASPDELAEAATQLSVRGPWRH